MSYSKLRDEYLESEVLCAGPVRRIQLLYEGALEAIAQARAAIAAGDIRTRNDRTNKAMSILVELALSLDHSRGGQFTKDLVELYDYSQRRLLEGNIHQKDAPYAEVEGLLKTVLDGWKNIAEVGEPAPASSPSWASADPQPAFDESGASLSRLNQLA